VYNLANRAGISQGIAHCAQEEGHLVYRQVRVLLHWHINDCRKITRQVVIPRVSRQSHDFYLLRFRVQSKADHALPDRITAGEICLSPSLIHNGDGWSAPAVGFVEFAAGQQRNAHSGKEARCDAQDVSGGSGEHPEP
jgi:hypothetical protein